METWMLYGLLAAAFLGASRIAMKVASGPGHYNMGASTGAILVLIGAAAVFIPYYLMDNNFSVSLPSGNNAILLAIASGVFWGIASVFLYKGFNLGADASKVIPLVNTSALFAVAPGILPLHETPSHGDSWRAAIGASMFG